MDRALAIITARAPRDRTNPVIAIQFCSEDGRPSEGAEETPGVCGPCVVGFDAKEGATAPPSKAVCGFGTIRFGSDISDRPLRVKQGDPARSHSDCTNGCERDTRRR
jgi:hypothetical protein